ncbi:MAG: motility associated factor glycosyltransferase family protein [bacterium]|nr:motility associated factor glycosyltransferase family protein [bacterium]
MNIYENNLEFLKQFNTNLYKVATVLPDQNVTTPPSKAGPLTMTYRFNNQDYFIHSKFNPDAEANKMIQKVNLDADHIVVLGLGCGYHLHKLIKAKKSKCRVLLVEPELEILKHSFKACDWESLFSRQDFFFLFGKDLNTLSDTLQAFINVATFNKLEILELASEVRFFKEFFDKVKSTIDNEIKSLLYDFKTRLAEDSVVPKNILKNIDGILHSRPVKSLKDRFAGKPGFIVSAGPSLDKNILLLKKIRDRAIIMCVDTALKPLLKRGIHPHFIVTADPSYKNYLHLLGTEDLIKYFLISDTGISSRVYSDFRKHIFSVSLGKPLFKMIEQNIGEVGEIDAWGSVISLALNFAIYIGLDTISFLGQDFAFTDTRNHCRWTSWEDTWRERSKELNQLQRREKQSITGIAKMIEPLDIYGNKTLTSDRLMMYKNYLAKAFASFPGKRFFNASEGGILTEIEARGLQHILEEFVFPGEAIQLDQLFDIPTIYNSQNQKQLVTFFKAKAGFFRKYKKKLTDIIGKLKQTAHQNIKSTALLLQEAEKVKDQLYSNIQNGEILEMWSQGPIYNFLRKTANLQGQPLTAQNIPQFTDAFRVYFEKLLPLVSDIIKSFDAGIVAPADDQTG